MDQSPEKEQPATFVVFLGTNLLTRGSLAEVASAAKQRLEAGALERIACFDERTGRTRDLDLSGNEAEVIGRLGEVDDSSSEAAAPLATKRGRGRPKLGVVSREVSLLPRHWEWLAEQPQGASASLRRLVDAARKQGSSERKAQKAIEAAHRFMWDMAGNQAGFEEAGRALFARDFSSFRQRTASWPSDIREQLERFLKRAQQASKGASVADAN